MIVTAARMAACKTDFLCTLRHMKKLGLLVKERCKQDIAQTDVWFQKISIPPPPPNGRSSEIPRGRGDSKAVISEGWGGGFMGKYFSRA